MARAAAKTAEPEILPPEKPDNARHTATKKAPKAARAAPPKNEVAVHRPGAAAVSEGTMSVRKLIADVAKDPNADVDKFDRLLALQERMEDRDRKATFDAALARMQPHLPIIHRTGLIEVRAKDREGQRTGAVTQSTKYAKWEDINEAIMPVLGKYGFGLSFRTGDDAGKIKVTAILSHEAGHREETSLVLMHDSTGSKNSVQAVGSSVSYGKRYTACALLNITTRDEDDDADSTGKAVTVGDPVTAEQAEVLVDLARAVECPAPTLIKRLNETRPKGHPVIKEIADLPASRFEECKERLRVFEANKKAKAAEDKQ